VEIVVEDTSEVQEIPPSFVNDKGMVVLPCGLTTLPLT
jgi:hypothetical protein